MPPRSRRRSPSAAPADRFGPDYYRRFYGDPRTRVVDSDSVGVLADFVAGYVRYLDIDVRTILDMGCGHGHWRAAAARLWPRARYHGVEFSEHLCAEFGWTQGSIVDFDPAAAFGRERFDLVVCQGVLQYLDDRAAARALRNLGRWVDGALYLEALTERDWRQNCDRERTDGDVHLRPGAWYRQRLARDFVAGGGGVFVGKRAGATLFELEAL